MRTAPQPPSRLSLLWIGLSAGAAAVAGGLALADQVTGAVPSAAVVVKVAVALIGAGFAAVLGVKHLLQRARRNAWWDGFAAGDEPLADVIQMPDMRGDTGTHPRISPPRR